MCIQQGQLLTQNTLIQSRSLFLHIVTHIQTLTPNHQPFGFTYVKARQVSTRRKGTNTSHSHSNKPSTLYYRIYIYIALHNTRVAAVWTHITSTTQFVGSASAKRSRSPHKRQTRQADHTRFQQRSSSTINPKTKPRPAYQITQLYSSHQPHFNIYNYTPYINVYMELRLLSPQPQPRSAKISQV